MQPMRFGSESCAPGPRIQVGLCRRRIILALRACDLRAILSLRLRAWALIPLRHLDDLRSRERPPRQFEPHGRWLAVAAPHVRPHSRLTCHANSRCSRLGDGHPCALGLLLSLSSFYPVRRDARSRSPRAPHHASRSAPGRAAPSRRRQLPIRDRRGFC